MNTSIMIVDDSPYIIDGLATLLRRRGYEPVIARDGDECLRLLASSVPDLIMLDIMMEPKDGWETLEEIRSNPVTRNIPVLMFSAKRITPSEAAEHSLGIDDFIVKPINPVQLLGAIEHAFARRSELEREVRCAREAGLDDKTVEEYTRLLRSTGVDTRMLDVIRVSSGMDIPGKVVPEADRRAISCLEEKIGADKARLNEISAQITRK